jgi:hypothetical protein
MNKLVILFFAAFSALTNSLYAQTSVVQIIKGSVRDIDSHFPIIGATVVIENLNPVIEATTDRDGNFKLTQVPVGRHTIKITYLGYETYYVRELLIGSGKEIVLSIDLKESTIALNEVSVKAYSNKEKPINSMASISARQLSVEEANRYAGGFDDPARLASSFAGVSGSLANNGIVIRGNSPKGMLWRMEGVEISTPSHFANITTFGGGGITALSSQILTNSDFYTGAFPAEYGNALSGVFDLKLRTGNNEKTEYTLQAGVIGLDFAMEGPFIKGRKSSFLFNYRYSTFSLLQPLLPDDAGGIRYQDLCFKLNFPTLNAGTFSIWGIGALDKNPQHAEEDSSKWTYTQDMEEGINNLGMGGLGLNHNILLGNKSYLHTSLAVSGNGLDHSQKRYNDDRELEPLNKVKFYNWKYTFSSFLNHKFGPKHTNRSGIIVNRMNYDIDIRETKILGNSLAQLINSKASSNLFQYYTQSKIEVNSKLTINAGLHGQYFSLNNKNNWEPRVGVSYAITPKQMVSFGYGMHSQTEMIQVYLIRSGNNFPNKNLDFARAQHFILGYNWKINPNLRFKAEPYIQILSQIPVMDKNSFSVLNLDKDWYLTDSLCNKGKGRNIGIDFTLEHFLYKGYYYLVTASFLQSKYKGGDGIERNTRYNRNYVINILGGKEWTLKNYKILSMNGRLNFLGGERISPLNVPASLSAKEAIYDETQAFSDAKPDVWYADITINYKINRKNHSSTWSLKLINILGTKEFNGYRYNHKTNLMEKEEEAIIIPNLSYKIEF